LSATFARGGTKRRGVFAWLDDVRTGRFGRCRGILALGGEFLFELANLFRQRRQRLLLLQQLPLQRLHLLVHPRAVVTGVCACLAHPRFSIDRSLHRLYPPVTAYVKAATQDVPNSKHSQNLAKRFIKHGAAYFEFMTTPGVEPTNNLAEQAIRFVVIDRHITQGTHGETGRRWCERIWTVIATCTRQGKSVFEYLCDAVKAYFNDKPAPSLVANG
jgi:hypothetical protein